MFRSLIKSWPTRFATAFLLVVPVAVAENTDFDLTGIPAFRDQFPGYLGDGIRVIIAEAGETPNTFQIDPVMVGQPLSLFTYYSKLGQSSQFPNDIGKNSGHANTVGNIFIGKESGVAPNVSHIDNFDGIFFFNEFVVPNRQPPARIINQSFILAGPPPSAIEAEYDDFIDRQDVLIISSSGNSGMVQPPSTSYNAISVASMMGSSSVGPTTDGRSKPDITAPAFATSFSAPLVSGVAAVLLQAAQDGHGGTNTISEAKRSLVLKSLILNGSRKPDGWTNSPMEPLDHRHGAGVVNLFHSHQQLIAGKQSFSETTKGVEPAAGIPSASGVGTTGWDLNTITSSFTQDSANHYPFSTGSTSSGFFTLTWNKRFAQPQITDLDLFLFQSDTRTLIGSSVSKIDNVEHIYLPTLPAGEYDLVVVKKGGGSTSTGNQEIYALAWQLVSQNVELNVLRKEGELEVSWIGSKSGLILEIGRYSGAILFWKRYQGPVESLGGKVTARFMANEETGFFRLRQP